MRALEQRIAGAPITWGVSEVPGWGVQLPPERVLGEMRALGLAATELGPDGYLPAGAEELRTLLTRHGLELVGGFVTAVLHDPSRLHRELPDVERQARHIAAAGGDTLVLAAATGSPGYDGTRRALDRDGWRALIEALELSQEIADRHSLRLVLHPHVGTTIERANEVELLLERTEVQLCLDTGHLAIGGADVLQLARDASARIGHVHVKDVDLQLAARVREGDLEFAPAVAEGVFVPLGRGGVPMLEVVAVLEAAGYSGWYVLEQDTALLSDAADPASDAHLSLAAMRQVAAGARA